MTHQEPPRRLAPDLYITAGIGGKTMQKASWSEVKVIVVTLAQHCSRHRVKTVSYHTVTMLWSELIYEQPRSLQISYQGRGKKAEKSMLLCQPGSHLPG